MQDPTNPGMLSPQDALMNAIYGVPAPGIDAARLAEDELRRAQEANSQPSQQGSADVSGLGDAINVVADAADAGWSILSIFDGLNF